MKAVVLMFDSLNRRHLSPYGAKGMDTPNFDRLADRGVKFTNCYAGSLPCIPARRELHSGRYNFFHRSWGPLEPFDYSVFEHLSRLGVHTHLVSDHYHYWEDGGATYHNRYSTWEAVRGQEGDNWKGQVKKPEPAQHYGHWEAQDRVNRKYFTDEERYPQTRTIDLGLEFIETNARADNWLLQIETFDPHEPFDVPEHYREADGYDGPLFDWPKYARVNEPAEAVEHCRRQYEALVRMCDRSLGRVLDAFDKHDLWKDTLLIVCTDHGFLLGEHGWWAKVVQPFYNEVSHIPLFVVDPRNNDGGSTREDLVQTMDLPPTLLSYFGVDEVPETVTGFDISSRAPRETALFGMHGGHINITDGRYVYMRGTDEGVDEGLFNYTLMCTHMRAPFPLEELRGAVLHEGFDFTKGSPVLKVPRSGGGAPGGEETAPPETMLFDLRNDPQQEHPFRSTEIEERLCYEMVKHLKRHEAPEEVYAMFGLTQYRGREADRMNRG